MTVSDRMTPPRAPRPFGRRLILAAMLDAELYEEVEADRMALPQAALVVVLAALGFGIGSFANGGLAGVLWITLTMLSGWVGWACLTYWIGSRLLATPDTETDAGELLRTLGFSAAPGCCAVFGIVPGLTPWLFTVILIWMLATMVVAIRQALDYRTTARALAVCAVGIPFVLLLLIGVLLLTGPWPL